MRPRFLSGLLVSTALISHPALAQDVFELDEIVVSASLSPVEASRTGASVDVLQGQAVGQNDGRVVDRLSRLAGVNLTSNGGLGALATVQVRGLPARYVSARINGIDVSDPSGTQNQFNFGGLTASGVQRIEVLKGSQSALYGSEAIAGVVDISTFRPNDPGFSGQAQVEGGSFETYGATASVGYLGERGDIGFSYGYVESEGISARASDNEKDGFEQSTLNIAGEYQATDMFTVGGALYYRDSDIEIDRSTTDPSGEISSEELGARVFGVLQTGAVRHEFSYSYFDIDRRDPGGFTTRFQGERNTFAYLGNAGVSPSTVLNFGLERTEEDIDSGSVVGNETNDAAFFEALYSPTGEIDLSAAFRYDDNSSFGGEVTGRLAAVWRPMDDLAVRAVVGTGYRAPSLFERFSSFGDPTLQPENSVSYEVGVEKTYGDAGFVKATLFYTDIDDLIDFDPAATACGSGFGCYNQIPGTTTSKGFEVSGEYFVTDAISLFGAYTYTDAKTDGERLSRTPRHDLAFGLNSDFSVRLSGYFDIRYVADIEPSQFAPADNKVGDYTLVGAGVSYDVSDRAELYLRIENLFDEDYETAGGFNQPGRAAYVGLRATF